MEMKICSKCSVEQQLTEFHKNTKTVDGYKCWCKTCVKEYDKKAYKLRYSKDKININKKSKIHYDNNSKYYKNYRITNKSIIKKSINTAKKKRYHSDPVYRLKEIIRRAINYHFKTKNLMKKTNTLTILGCSFDEFKSHIESKFESWMNWDNYGKYNGTECYGWDIDHITPIATAITEEDIIRLNHWSNLQPLCSYNNRVIKKDNPKSRL